MPETSQSQVPSHSMDVCIRACSRKNRHQPGTSAQFFKSEVSASQAQSILTVPCMPHVRFTLMRLCQTSIHARSEHHKDVAQANLHAPNDQCAQQQGSDTNRTQHKHHLSLTNISTTHSSAPVQSHVKSQSQRERAQPRSRVPRQPRT